MLSEFDWVLILVFTCLSFLSLFMWRRFLKGDSLEEAFKTALVRTFFGFLGIFIVRFLWSGN